MPPSRPRLKSSGVRAAFRACAGSAEQRRRKIIAVSKRNSMLILSKAKARVADAPNEVDNSDGEEDEADTREQISQFRKNRGVEIACIAKTNDHEEKDREAQPQNTADQIEQGMTGDCQRGLILVPASRSKPPAKTDA